MTQEISEYDDDPIIGPLLREFLDSLASQVRELGPLQHANKFEAISKVAHRIKGGAMNYGFARIGRLAHEVEELCGVETADSDRLSLKISALGALIHGSQKNLGP